MREERGSFVCSPAPLLGVCPTAGGRMLLQAELGTSLPSLQQGCELTMTILLGFQMERSHFSALILGTALPLLVFNPHHPSYTRVSRHPPSLPLNPCMVTACPSGLSTSVPSQGLGASNTSPSSRPGAVGNTMQGLFCLLPTSCLAARLQLSCPHGSLPALPCQAVQG